MQSRNTIKWTETERQELQRVILECTSDGSRVNWKKVHERFSYRTQVQLKSYYYNSVLRRQFKDEIRSDKALEPDSQVQQQRISINSCSDVDIVLLYATSCSVKSEFLKLFHENEAQLADSAFSKAVSINIRLKNCVGTLKQQPDHLFLFDEEALHILLELVNRIQQEIVELRQKIQQSEAASDKKEYCLKFLEMFETATWLKPCIVQTLATIEDIRSEAQ